MNKAILMGRLTRDPDIRYTQGDNPMCIARYTLAVDRRFNRNNDDGNNGKRVIDMWQEREWKTARGTPVKNKNEWQRLYNKLRVFEQSGGTFEFVSMQEEDEADCDSRGKIARTIERSMTDTE